MAIQSSILTWKSPWTEEPGGLQPVGWQRVVHDWRDLAHTHAYCRNSWFTGRFLSPRGSHLWQQLLVLMRPSPMCRNISTGNEGNSAQFSRSAVSHSLRPHETHTPDLPVHHQLPEFTQTHAHRGSDAIQPSHPLSVPSPPAPNPSQHQGLFQWVNSAWGGQSTGVSASAPVRCLYFSKYGK